MTPKEVFMLPGGQVAMSSDAGRDQSENQTLGPELLYRLYRRRVWGGKHVPWDMIVRNEASARVMDELIREGLVVETRNNNRRHLRLNINRKKDIEDLIMVLIVP